MHVLNQRHPLTFIFINVYGANCTLKNICTRMYPCYWVYINNEFCILFSVLAYQSDLTVLLVLSCLYGFGRSMVIVARNIAISENCRLDQVPAAVGLGMLSMGMIVPPTGYFLGWIRDYTGSFIVCISAQNALLVAFLIMWVPDMIMIWFEERRRKKKNVDVVEMSWQKN